MRLTNTTSGGHNRNPGQDLSGEDGTYGHPKTPPPHITSTRDGRYKAVYIYDEIKCQLQQIILRYENKWAWLTVHDKETQKNINT